MWHGETVRALPFYSLRSLSLSRFLAQGRPPLCVCVCVHTGHEPGGVQTGNVSTSVWARARAHPLYSQPHFARESLP